MIFEMENQSIVVRTSDRDERVEVPVVQSRSSDERGVVSVRSTDRATADDLMALASQLTAARDLVRGRACDRLHGIAQQMEFLHMKAKQVLEDAARDEELHKVACNMQKQPGRVYHLYQRDDKYKYFSMLAPHEWNNPEKADEFKASYRLELDRSWTPLEQTEKRDDDFAAFQMVQHETLVVDNGACYIKCGLASDEQCSVVPNAIIKSKQERKRAFVGSELAECADRSGLFFALPFEKGYLVNWDVEEKVWEKTLGAYDPANTRVAITDPNYLVPAIKDLSSEVLFETLGFAAIYKTSAPGLVAQWGARRGSEESCCLVVDCGYSFTHIAPFVDGKLVQAGVLRIDLGGKALTNLLKEWISYRELNVLEETYVINECKEDCCFVSQDLEADMDRARRRDGSLLREYALPDFVSAQRGHMRERPTVRDDAQVLTMNVERFALPECLFRPSDAGVHQMGVAEAVCEAVRRCPENVRASLLLNIHLVGGSTKFPGFSERLLGEVRSEVESIYSVRLASVVDPMSHAWHCGKQLVSTSGFHKKFVTRAEYEEHGEELCKRRFLHFL